MYLEIFLADFAVFRVLGGDLAGFCGNTWISQVRDRAKYQKPCLEMASCWPIFFGKANEILHSANMALIAKGWAWYMWLVELIANFIKRKTKITKTTTTNN